MKLILDHYPGWTEHPVYTIIGYTKEEFDEFFQQCRQLQIETFALSYSNRLHTFQVATNHELFVLKWL